MPAQLLYSALIEGAESNFLCGITLALLDLLQCPHGAVQRMSVVASELGIGALERWVAVSLRLLDAVDDLLVSFHGYSAALASALSRMCRTRFCAPSSIGCAETSSLTLRENRQYSILDSCSMQSTYWPLLRFVLFDDWLEVDDVRPAEIICDVGV